MTGTKLSLNGASKQFALACIAMVWLAGFCWGQPKLTLGTKSGPPTTTVLVSGSGLPAEAAVDLYFDSADLALAVTNSTGAFSKIAIEVPASALPGTHYVTAVARSNGEAAQTTFSVQTNWAEEGFTPKGKRSNPYENLLSPSTVGAIDLHWSYPTGGAVISSPAIANKGGVVYVGSLDDNVYALNATTGAKLWSYPTGSYVDSSPAVANGVVYVGSYDDNVYAFDQQGGLLVRTKQPRPDPKTLQPDFTLKPSQPVTQLPGNDNQ